MKVLKKSLNEEEVKRVAEVLGELRLPVDLSTGRKLTALLYEDDPIPCWKCGSNTEPWTNSGVFARDCPSCRTQPFPYCGSPEQADETARLLYDHFHAKEAKP